MPGEVQTIPVGDPHAKIQHPRLQRLGLSGHDDQNIGVAAWVGFPPGLAAEQDQRQGLGHAFGHVGYELPKPRCLRPEKLLKLGDEGHVGAVEYVGLGPPVVPAVENTRGRQFAQRLRCRAGPHARPTGDLSTAQWGVDLAEDTKYGYLRARGKQVA